MELNIFDPQYVQKQQIASLQQMAANQNALRVQAFQTACANYLSTQGKAPVPVIPKKITVDEAGNWTEATFPDLVVPALPDPSPSTGSLRPSVPVVDRTDQIIAILGVMNAKLDALAGK